MGVSENRGFPPKSSTLNHFNRLFFVSFTIHFGGKPTIFGSTPISYHADFGNETKQTDFPIVLLVNLLVETSDQTIHSSFWEVATAGASGERLCLVHCRGDNHVAHHFKPRYWKRSNSDLSLRSSWEPTVPPPPQGHVYPQEIAGPNVRPY